MMVIDGVSLCQIKKYLSRWVYWWVKTAVIWNYDELARRYIESCWNTAAAHIGAAAFQKNNLTSSRNDVYLTGRVSEFAFAA